MLNAHIAIIGAGSVGASIAFALVAKNIGTHITLVDVNRSKLEGEVMDLQHGLFFTDSSHVNMGTYNDVRRADIVIITAGAAQKPGETRLDLLQKNTSILKSILRSIGKIQKNAIILIVSNPVDVLTYIAQKISGLPESQIFGSGTTLDTSRLRYYLGQYYSVDPKSVHAYILGEHGDSEIAAYSSANIAGVPLKKYPKFNQKKLDAIFEKTKNAAYEIIKRKGATNFAIALAVTEILEAILYDQNRILPLSVRVPSHYKKAYALPNVCLGLPAVLGRSGVQRVVDVGLNASEAKRLKKSADTMKKAIGQLA